MDQFFTIADSGNLLPGHPSRLGAHGARVSQIAVFVSASVLAFLFAGWTPANGQTPLSPGLAQSPTQPAASADNSAVTTPIPGSDKYADSNSSLNAGNLTPSFSLSSSQIIDILQQNPDLVLELKSQVADRMQEQGMQIDANEISDEMLYDLIAGNAGLRANITSFLRARGYVTDDDLQTVASGINGVSDETGTAQRVLQQTGAISTQRVPAESGLNPGLETGQSRFESSGLPATTTRSASSTGQRQNLAEKRDQAEVNSSTDLPKVLRLPAPYNLRSMRDLYTQIPDQTAHLKRFGSEVFSEPGSGYGARCIAARHSAGHTYRAGLRDGPGGHAHHRHVGQRDRGRYPRG